MLLPCPPEAAPGIIPAPPLPAGEAQPITARSGEPHSTAAATAASAKVIVPAVAAIKTAATAAKTTALGTGHAAAVAANRAVAAESHIDQRDDGDDGLAWVIATAAVGARHEQSAPQAGAAASEQAARAALRLHVLQGQVFDRDVARIDEEAVVGVGAVDGLDLRATAAVRSLDGQGRAALQVDRQKLRRQRNRAGNVDDVIVLKTQGVDNVDRVIEIAFAAYIKSSSRFSVTGALFSRPCFARRRRRNRGCSCCGYERPLNCLSICLDLTPSFAFAAPSVQAAGLLQFSDQWNELIAIRAPAAKTV